jgi:hypothetical protein
MRIFLTFWAAAALGVAVFIAPFAFLSLSAQAADKVGVAAAVKPEATSQKPGGATATLKIRQVRGL